MITTVLRCWSEMLFIMITGKKDLVYFFSQATLSFPYKIVHYTEKIKPEIVFVYT